MQVDQAFKVLLQEIDGKIDQLQEAISDGKAEDYAEYKRVCGEVRGLLTARSYIIGLNKRLEESDD
jgi:hypothetical protein